MCLLNFSFTYVCVTILALLTLNSKRTYNWNFLFTHAICFINREAICNTLGPNLNGTSVMFSSNFVVIPCVAKFFQASVYDGAEQVVQTKDFPFVVWIQSPIFLKIHENVNELWDATLVKSNSIAHLQKYTTSAKVYQICVKCLSSTQDILWMCAKFW